MIETNCGLRPRAFWTEMLMLAGIAAALAALLEPVAARARSQSPFQVCAGHMMQLGLAMNSYVRDWDDTYPLNQFSGSSQSTPYNWRRALLQAGYVTSPGVFLCPANQYAWASARTNGCARDQSNCAPTNIGVPGHPLPDGYAYNGGFFDDFLGVRSIHDIAVPSHLIVLLESSGGYPDLGDWAVASVFVHPNRRANWLMADGSVRALKIVQTIQPMYLWRNPNDIHAATIGAILYHSR